MKAGKRGEQEEGGEGGEKEGEKRQNPPQWIVGQNGTGGNEKKSANRLVMANERRKAKMCQFSGAVTQ